MERLKESKGAVAGEVLTSLSGVRAADAPRRRRYGRWRAEVPQRNFNTVTTNVPGPQHPLYALGRQVLESLPYVPIQGRMRIGIAIFSYDGMLRFGITGDYDTAPDIEVLARGIEDGMAELLKRAEQPVPLARESDRIDQMGHLVGGKGEGEPLHGPGQFSVDRHLSEGA